MLEKIRKLKDRKGFTLVELIVVLVILAILAALLVPALTGYIDKANDEKVVATTRSIVMAAQTEVSEAYGKASAGKLTGATTQDVLAGTTPVDGVTPVEIGVLAEVVTKTTDAAGKPVYTKKNNGIDSATVTWNAAGHVTEVVVKQSGRQCTYTESTGEYKTEPVA